MLTPISVLALISKFNEHLNSHYPIGSGGGVDPGLSGIVRIGPHDYPISFALEKVDPRVYSDKLEEWKINMESDGKLVMKDGQAFWVEPDEERVIKTPAKVD